MEVQVLLNDTDKVVRATADRAESASVDISFPGGLFSQSLSNPAERDVQTHEFSFRYRLLGASTWIDAGDMTVASKQNSQFRRTHTIKFPTPGEYEIEVSQTTSNNPDAHHSDDAYLSAIRTFRTGNLPSHEDIAEIAIRVKATDQLNGQVNTLNAIVHKHVPIWNGVAWSAPVPSRHPAWILAEAVRGKHLRRPVADAMINLEELKDWADSEPHWTCDINIETSTRVADVLDIICASGRARFALTDLQYSVIREQPNAPVRQLYSPRNSWAFKGTVSFPRPVHALRVVVRSERLNWEEDEVIVYADGYNNTNATEFETLRLPGVVITASDNDEGNAYRLGRYHLAVTTLRRETFEWMSDFEHLQVQRGDPVQIVHDVPGVGVGSARIKFVKEITGTGLLESVTLDERFDVAQASFRMTVRGADGTRYVFTAQSPSDTSSRTWLQQGASIGYADLSVGDLVVIEELAQESLEAIITGVYPSSDESARLTAVPRSTAVATADNGSIPTYNPIITVPRDELTRGPAAPVVVGLLSDQTTSLVDRLGRVRPRLAVSLQSILGNVSAGAYLQMRWLAADEQTWVYGDVVPVSAREIVSDLVEVGLSYKVEVRSVGPLGQTRGWVDAGTVTAAVLLSAPLVPVYLAADTPSGQGARNLVNGAQITVRWEHRLTNDAGAAVHLPASVEVWRGESASLVLSGGDPTNATLLGTSVTTHFIDSTSAYQSAFYYFLRAVGHNGAKSDFDAGRLVVTGTAADNRVPNGDFGAGSDVGWNLYGDTSEPANPLNISVVERDPNSNFVPEQTCPFPGMIKIEMGLPVDSVAEYEVNSGDTANSDHPNFTREHVICEVDRLMPIQSDQDTAVSFSMAELSASVANGWSDDGDYGPMLRMFFYDADGVKITAGRGYEDAYALVSGPEGIGADVWQRRTAVFSPPDTASFCSFEIVGLGSEVGQAVGFGVTYASGFEVRTAAGTQSLGRGSVHARGRVGGTDLAPSTDNTTEVVLAYTIAIPSLPAKDDSGEDVDLRVRAGGIVRTSGGENAQFFIRLGGLNNVGVDYSVQSDLNLDAAFIVSAGASYTLDLTMKSTDVSITDLDDGFLDIEATLR